MKKFEANKTYSTRSICNSDCIISVTIEKRTPKTVTTTDGKSFRVSVLPDQSGEFIRPWGNYSMAPMIRA